MRKKKVLVYGSLNLDYVYQVDHIVKPGETISSGSMQVFCGGKGLNQAIAFAKAGMDVYIAGKIGSDGQRLQAVCKEYGIHTDFLKVCSAPSGSAVIQVDAQGENCIVLFGGANLMHTKEEIDGVFSFFAPGDYVVLQNEINELGYIISRAEEKQLQTVLNPSPYEDGILQCNLHKLSWLILNEVEAHQITAEEDPNQALRILHERMPSIGIVLTLGEKGAVCLKDGEIHHQKCYQTKAIDTTAAGDTFTGYFISLILEGKAINEALDVASRAAAITVSRRGAAQAIPYRKVIEEG